jgi:hypothetical protein
MTTKQAQSLAMLSAMNQAQSQQFMAATLLAIAVVMKKAGVDTLDITPEDFSLLRQGESLEPIRRVDGGYTYKFVQADAPLAKKPVPKKVLKAAAKAAGRVLGNGPDHGN